MIIQKKKSKKTKNKKQPLNTLTSLSVCDIKRIRINFIALTAPTSKMQTRINYLFSTNFTVFDDFAFYIDMIDSAKIVGAF